MIKWTQAVSVALVLSVLLPGGSAEACSCALPDHAAAVDMYQVAFEGRVVSVTARAEGMALVRFRVLTAFKGVTTRFVEVIAPDASRASGFLCPRPTFRDQRSYRVYVNANEIGGALEVEGCNPSRVVTGRRGRGR